MAWLYTALVYKSGGVLHRPKRASLSEKGRVERTRGRESSLDQPAFEGERL